LKRSDLEHVIRAAADIVQDEIVVVGSQAILGQFPDAPESLLFSQEADVYPRSNPERAIEIDGALGDGSQFHATNGYYAHGVGPETAKAPAGWKTRLIPVVVSTKRGEVRGWCLEAHDLVLAKCAAGRERDWEFAEHAIAHDIVDPDELLKREPDLPLSAEHHDHLRPMLAGTIKRAKNSADTK
jgi:hypothetical protein